MNLILILTFIKYVKKLIFINVGVYVGNMNFFKIIDTNKVRDDNL